MIQFADDSTKQAVRDMWKICFGDSDAYMDIYFNHKYRNENTLIYIEDNKAVASLQLLFFNFTFHGREIPIAYLSGLCTLPNYRNQGFMKQLIIKSYQVAKEREIPLMILVPQDKGVMNYYERFGFAQTFDPGIETLPQLSKIMEANNEDIHKAYDNFNSLYRDNDMTVQKSFTDFEAILEEAKLFNYPPKTNLTGMARVIDAERLISIYSSKYPTHSLALRIVDDLIHENKKEFMISHGNVEVIKPSTSIEKDIIEVHISELAQFLMGYHTSERARPLSSMFPETKPAMHFMLE
jgi:predicted acetyltransferase